MENIENVGSWQQLFIPTCTDRIKNAKKRVLTSMEICLERARAQMKVMKEHGSEPMVIQRALMFKTYLEEKTIFIQDGELIIGNITSKVRGGSFAAEMVDFMDAELGHPEKDFEIRPHEKFIITPEERKELREEIIPFFKGNTLGDYILRRADEDVVRKAYSVTAEDPHIPVIGDLSLYKDLGHQMVNYEKVLYKGLKGVREEIVRYMEELEQPYTRYGRESKRDFYQASLICVDAVIAYAKRYSKLAESMAESEQDEVRKQELERIAHICAKVPENPAGDWWEALQSLWMIHLAVHCEIFNVANSLGRFDQYMYPFFKKSVIEDKTMSRDFALELLESLWIKFNEWAILLSYDVANFQPGQGLSQTVTIGGQTCEGKDACNELTLLCLEAEEQVGLAHPDLAMRLWEGTPKEYIKRAVEVIRLGRGKPKFISDSKAIKMAATGHYGLSVEDLRECSVMGCTELTLPHNSMLHSWEGICLTPKILELVLFDGKCSLCGRQLGPQTGDPRTFESMSEVQGAFIEQLYYWMTMMVRGIQTVKEVQAERLMIPLSSALSDGPLQKGRDIAQGGSWFNNCGIYLQGLADTADSLAVIHKLIYLDKKVTWDELLTALKDNWEGHEALRQLCVNGVPKYGNDDDYADSWAVWVMDTWYDCVDWINDQRSLAPNPYPDSLYLGAGMIGQSNVSFGPVISALPNGRSNPRPTADCISPFPGVDRKGATAVIKSVSKLPTERFAMGGLLNLRLSAQLVANDEDIERFIAFLRSVEELGVYHTQFNVVSTELLRKAMEKPEDYRDVLVRVASYMAYFVELTKEQQLDIISRTEYQGW